MSSPCLSHNCSKCCYKTEMTLTNEDVSRIEGLGYKNFYDYQEGYLILKNKNGHCIFLKRDLCSIYNSRPAGCRLYPLIMDLDTGEAILHDFCPYTDEFVFTGNDEERLAEIIELEEKEKDERVLNRLHELSG